MSAVAAIILAAGASTRYRAADDSIPTKLVALLDGVPLVRHVAEAALASGARPVVVVTGFARERVETALRGLDLDVVHNQDFAAGLSGSLRVGLDALPEAARGALVLLGDMPRVGAALIDGLLTAFLKAEGIDAVVPVYSGRRGNPALIGRSLFDAASRLTGDEGARRLLAKARVMEVEVFDAAVTWDIDDPEALRRLGTLTGARPDRGC